MAPKIILDAGHGGFDNGASYGDRREKDDTLRLTLDVGEKLSQAGYPVSYIRTEDMYESPYQKAQKANDMGGDLFLSFHRNSSMEENLYSGVQALVYDMGLPLPVRVGEAITDQLETVGFQNLGVEAVPGLIVLRRTQMPAVLMEVGFLNNDQDNVLFDEKYPQIVQAIVDGVMEALPLPLMEQSEVSEETVAEPRYFVQTGIFKHDVNAAYQLERLQIMGFDGQIHYEAPYYGVWAGSVPTLEEAVKMQEQLRENGYHTLIVTGSNSKEREK